MNPSLKEFYAQDASLKKLETSDQIRLFEAWAKTKEVHLRLSFERKVESKPWKYSLTAAALVIMVFAAAGKGTNLYGIVFVLLFFFVQIPRPRVLPIEPTVAGQG